MTATLITPLISSSGRSPGGQTACDEARSRPATTLNINGEKTIWKSVVFRCSIEIRRLCFTAENGGMDRSTIIIGTNRLKRMMRTTATTETTDNRIPKLVGVL